MDQARPTRKLLVWRPMETRTDQDNDCKRMSWKI